MLTLCVKHPLGQFPINCYRSCKRRPPSARSRRSGVTHIKRDHPVRGVGARTGRGGSHENEGVRRAIDCPKDDERIGARTHTTSIVSDYAHMAWRCSWERESQVGSGPCRAGRTRGSSRRTSGRSESSRSRKSSRCIGPVVNGMVSLYHFPSLAGVALCSSGGKKSIKYKDVKSSR